MELMPQSINFSEKWNNLQEILQKVIKHEEVSTVTWNECIKDIYYICTAKPYPFGDELYGYTKLFLENHLLEIFNIIQNEGNANFLQNYYTFWNRYSKGAKNLNVLYQYFNNEYIKKKSTNIGVVFENVTTDSHMCMEIVELCFDLWKQNIIFPLKNNLSELLVDVLHQQGRYRPITTSLGIISSIIHSLVDIQQKKNPLMLYESCFEQLFMEQSDVYFRSYALSSMNKYTVPQYLDLVLKTLDQEDLQTRQYLHISSCHKILKICRKRLVNDYLEFLVHESKAFIKENRQNDMKNIYLLLRHFKNGIKLYVDIFGQHVQQCGFKIIESLEKKQKYIHFVEELSALHKKYSILVFVLFCDEPRFNCTIDKAFELFINHKFKKNQSSKSSEYLAQYCDYLLKKSTNVDMDELEIQEKLTKIIILFKYCDDKDVFQNLFQRYLAKRLIHQQSKSIDYEKIMINALKKLCGFKYTDPFYKMIDDVKISEELTENFYSEFLKSENRLNVGFSVSVLRTENWPLGLSSVSSFRIPKQLTPCIQYFEEFYKAKFRGRKLTWLYDNCQCELKLNYLPKVYTVSMQTFQMAILLLFEDNITLTYSEIFDLLDTNDQSLQKHIRSLGESKLLLIDDDNVSLNMAYFNERDKLCISTGLQNDTLPEIRRAVNNTTEGDRKMYIQAVIVRIMKARSFMEHEILVNEVLRQVKKCIPSPTFIKKCIEILIEKDYIQRDPNSPHCYNYVK